ncbi:hypothetical protein DSO57_1002890 [Entomophthora muscae]|uniref:Uncharacterized protein n=1 Tax=Entomophthora muscae TaxID=34485 RepID=A0ACC2SLX2_9FUNG|nr:hypothetical protein DSO57_1002890 [Entomophthora muscae]
MVCMMMATDIKGIQLILAGSEGAESNGDSLETAWKAEMANTECFLSIYCALYKLYGQAYMLVGIWKLVWGLFTWLGVYYFLSVLLQSLDPKSGWAPILGVKGGAGKVINILSTDVAHISKALSNLHFLWSAFVEAGLILVLLFISI